MSRLNTFQKLAEVLWSRWSAIPLLCMVLRLTSIVFIKIKIIIQQLVKLTNAIWLLQLANSSPLIHALGDPSQVPTRIRTRVPRLWGGLPTELSLPPSIFLMHIIHTLSAIYFSFYKFNLELCDILLGPMVTPFIFPHFDTSLSIRCPTHCSVEYESVLSLAQCLRLRCRMLRRYQKHCKKCISTSNFETSSHQNVTAKKPH